MAVELYWLCACVVLFFFHLLAESVAASRQYSTNELLAARDNLAPQNPSLSRTKRVTQNMIESMIMFTPLVLIAVLAGRTSSLTELGAALFFFARLIFAPLYWFGIPVARTVCWFVGVIGMGLILFQVLPFPGAN